MFNFLIGGFTWLIHLAALAVILDAVTTLYAVKSKIANEANPALNFIAKFIGFTPTVIASHAAIIFGLYYYASVITQTQIFIFLALFWSVVIWNIYSIAKYKKSIKTL